MVHLNNTCEITIVKCTPECVYLSITNNLNWCIDAMYTVSLAIEIK